MVEKSDREEMRLLKECDGGSLHSKWDVMVVGAGAAGLLAASRAAERGRKVLLLEKNRKPGVKILMSGGTRCNLTHATDKWGIIEAFGEQGRFLHSALAALGPSDLVELIESEGVRTKTEETGKIFPVSNKAVDVLNALVGRLRRSGAEMALAERVVDISRQGDGFIVHTAKRPLYAGRIIVTSGGQSYPGCGTSGDGYQWAKKLGHTIIPPRPALVPLTTSAEWVKALRGVTLPDVHIRLEERGKNNESQLLAERRGSFLLTHFGLSGPVAMDVSRFVTGHPQPRRLGLVCDFFPAVNETSFAAQLQTECERAGKKQVASIVGQWLPRRLIDSLMEQANIPGSRRAAELSRAERTALTQVIKSMWIPLSGTLGFKKAEVTAGGVPLEEIDSRTMQSTKVSNLFFAGEILDLDGPIGGYNFQAAFSSGWLAGDRV